MSTDLSAKQNIKKATVALNDALDQMALTDTVKAFPPKTEDYTFSSSAHGRVSKTDPILGHKTSINKLRKTEAILCTF